MEKSPFCGPNSRSDGQENARHLWKHKVHYHVHNSPSLDHVMKQMNLAHTLTPLLFKIYFNIIVPSMPLSIK
jgi:hypothetical protein